MSAAWVAGSTRARALASRRLGIAGARDLADHRSLESATARLRLSPYGPGVHPGQTLEEAQHAVAETVLWNLRVLAGWLPVQGAELLRALVGWFEIANVDEHLRALEGKAAGPYFRLGGLSTAWPRLAAAKSAEQVRAVLATSRWGDPGDATPRSIRLRMLTAWAARVHSSVPSARPWAAMAAALLATRVTVLEHRSFPASSVPALDAVFPGLASGADPLTLPGLPTATRDLLAGGPSSLPPDDQARALWQSEGRWWARVEADSFRLLRTAGFGSEPVVGAALVLAADARRVRAALGAARHGTAGRAVFDAVV